ncbi:MAG: TRAP transporter permease, partial [Rhodospirillales bacterium]|nr:TRAP transporter permease [Rhodospirillales bacterium]
ILPFLFALNPTLILHGTPMEIVQDVATAMIAIWLLAAGFEGWLYGVGRIGLAPRALVLLAGFGLLKPGIETDLFGLVLVGSVYTATIMTRRRRHTPA